MIEAMKQWLEALEDFVDVIKYDNEQDDIGRRACCDVLSYNPHREDCKAIKSIASLRQAIREHAMYEVQRLGQEIEQEPVAWMKPDVLCDRACMYLCTKGFTQFPECATTHPPQRTWVGLTDEEAQKTFVEHNCDISTHLAGILARAIKAKLKQKNGFAEEENT